MPSLKHLQRGYGEMPTTRIQPFLHLFPVKMLTLKITLSACGFFVSPGRHLAHDARLPRILRHYAGHSHPGGFCAAATTSAVRIADTATCVVPKAPLFGSLPLCQQYS